MDVLTVIAAALAFAGSEAAAEAVIGERIEGSRRGGGPTVSA